MSATQENFKTDRLLPNDIVTEDSAALDFVEQHGDNIRYCHSTGRWHYFDGAIWRPDETGRVLHLAREKARELAEEQDDRKRFITSKRAFAGNIEGYARSDPRVSVTAEYWDADPRLLGTPEGTVDLRTGILRPPDRADGITKSTLVAPAKGGRPALFLKFLGEATGHDQDLIRFLQQWCGYCLTGVTREHALVFVYGPGGNGKSVVLNLLIRILKSYAATSAMDTFTATSSDKHSTELAMLRGARLVTASETEEGRSWAEARIKQLTGGDRISARFMRQDHFEYTPQFKLMIVGNHQPNLNSVDDAAKRRFNIVPFLLKPEKPDPELENKLMEEAPAILQWMIEGCLDWQQNGLTRPESVRNATDMYFSDQDLLGQWIEEFCDVNFAAGDRVIWDRQAVLFASWTEYAKKAGEPPGKSRGFTISLVRRGFMRVRKDGGRGIQFIRLKNERGVTDDTSGH